MNTVKVTKDLLREAISGLKAYGGEATASTVAGIERVLRKDENHAKKLEDIDPAVAANLLLSNYVLDLAEDYLLAKQGKSKVTFETARKMTAAQKKMLGGFVKDGDVIKEKINPEIIAGIKVIINNSKQFDASMQKKLQNIF